MPPPQMPDTSPLWGSEHGLLEDFGCRSTVPCGPLPAPRNVSPGLPMKTVWK